MKIGDKVKLSEYAKTRNIWNGVSKNPKTGTIVYFHRYTDHPCVLRDGTNQAQYIHPDFIEVIK